MTSDASDHDGTDYGDYEGEDLLDPELLARTFPGYDGQLGYRTRQEPREGDHVAAGEVLPEPLAKNLSNDLYSHQAEAISRLADGENVTVATSTSSGKTWIYSLYYALLKQQNDDARALFLYPTKALAADQENEVNSLFEELGVDAVAEPYDGDTDTDRRPIIRDQRDVVISNFAAMNIYLNDDMLWADLLANCELLVIDECHTYTGIHGMHVSWVIRRLRRLLAEHGADPQIVCSTATIGNPKEHSEALVGTDFSVVDEDGSPRGAREIAFWTPPATSDDGAVAEVDDAELVPEIRRGANKEAAEVAAHLGLNGVQSLQFTRSRQETELGAQFAGRAAGDHPSGGYLNVAQYHAGLSKPKRKGTETKFKRGDVDTVISTSALELGIDIGGIDATVLAGYPGTRQSYWQRVGRAGRGGSDALSLFVPRGEAMDQYILDNPGFLLEDDVEDAVVDLSNHAVYAKHVLCAADERPLTREDADWFGPEERLERAVQMWSDAGQMEGDLDRGAQYNGPPRPQQGISMYATGDEQFRVQRVDGDIDMEPLDKERAYRDYHPGALVLYDGKKYEVVEFNEDRPTPVVKLQRANTQNYTQTQSDKTVSDVSVQRSRDLGNGYRICAGMGTVSVHYNSYTIVDPNTGEIVGMPQQTGLPPISYHTQLMWIEFPHNIIKKVAREVPAKYHLSPPEDKEEMMNDEEWLLGGGLHGGEHGMIKMAPLELRLDNDDMGGLSTLNHGEIGGPVWFIHDAVEGGVGFSHSIYDHFEAVARRTLERVDYCDCGNTTGCPACLMSSQCGNDNAPLHRYSTVSVLTGALDQLGYSHEGGGITDELRL